jgi:hypothetical protein
MNSLQKQIIFWENFKRTQRLSLTTLQYVDITIKYLRQMLRQQQERKLS